ncbi:MAG: hypothetical protein B7Y44_08655 [Sphingomonadales bacterium 28-55-16]|jgi:hypothetical protein|nr:MAG: hypothetical protein B7Y44_08655 [Sphingomonadales bacterium 28-55-16]
MVNFELEPAKQLASDIRSAHQAIDSALSDLANLTYSVIEVCRHSDAPPAHTQAVIEGVANGLTKMVDARKGFVNAHRKIAVAHRDSNLQEINFGCVPGPLTRPAGLRVVNG